MITPAVILLLAILLAPILIRFRKSYGIVIPRKFL
jgi:hypothetical protein